MKDMIEDFEVYDRVFATNKMEYPKPLLISESFISKVEDYVGIRFINKTKHYHEFILCLSKHAAKIKSNMYCSIKESIEEVKNGEDIDKAFGWIEYLSEDWTGQFEEREA